MGGLLGWAGAEGKRGGARAEAGARRVGWVSEGRTEDVRGGLERMVGRVLGGRSLVRGRLVWYYSRDRPSLKA